MKHALVFIVAVAIGIYVGSRFNVPVIGKTAG
jgi:hypothetical protein